MSSSLKATLNNGVEIPLLATGSYAPPTDDKAQAAVPGWILSAIKNGFRHIDTAWGYRTEKSVGIAIKESGLPREEIFVTTKLPWHHQTRVRESFEESLADLGTGYIDLYLLHWPQPISFHEGNEMPRRADGSYKTDDDVSFNDTWAEMEKLLDTGKVRAIGVSNFSVMNLEKLLATAKVVPAVNQVEMHPYLAQNGLRDYCTRKGILMTAYTPSGYSTVRNDPLIVSLAEKYNVTPTQVILAWHLSRKYVVIPTSKDSTRQKENLNIPNISEVDIEKIWHLDRGQRLCNAADPKYGQVWGWTLDQLGWNSYYAKFE
ncbi:Glycerol 2-dehydrogenase (NADP(+)) [Psilocybe cubensis]|uniref:Glycerol 2-dehydrogenase (NADP(+)) n=1 Tax=Psilocybe cubensis TaxID=181762 RepID=A0ACB8GPV8_PSICU|nr:Glycerol 2-dehydrogenase (NADP(+)) [Psilocybe cubensis]KAH9477442.1 Glycerol 2-dehydrogenase (NADP(+)) [Psilocybe cubensis]